MLPASTPVQGVLSVVGALIASLICGAAPAKGQEMTPAPPPPGALFGGRDEGREPRQALDFSLTLVEGYDTDAPTELLGIAPRELSLGGGSTVFVGQTAYQRHGQRVQVGAFGESVLRRHGQVESTVFSYSGGVGLSARLGARTQLTANQQVAYSPSHLYELFPGTVTNAGADVMTAGPDYAAGALESHAYHSAMTLTRGLSPRSRLSVAGEFGYTDLPRERPELRDVSAWGSRVEYARNLAQHTVLMVGYGYRTGTFTSLATAEAPPGGATATRHSLTVGVEHSRPLSATRALSFDLNLGSSTVGPSGSPVTDQAAPSHSYRLSGDASMSWQFAERWQTRAVFVQGQLEYVAGLGEPVFVDGFTAELSGLLSPRLDVLASARYSNGESALNRRNTAFDTYGVDVRARYALTRILAVYGEYFRYLYDFSASRRLAPGIPRTVDRHAVRAGLTLWVPALRK